MSPSLRFALLALPLAGLGWVWYDTAQRSAQGTEWDVPVGGYDPRDLLKGHYIQYTYQWPTTPADKFSTTGDASGLCLSGTAPVITSTRPLSSPEHTSAKSCDGILRQPLSDGRTALPSSGRLYVSEAVATSMQSALSDSKQQATLHFRLRPDGIIVPISLSFQPKP